MKKMILLMVAGSLVAAACTAGADSSSTTVSAPPTTTTTPPVVELTDEGVQAGSVWVNFGYDAEDAIAAVSSVLGGPTIDSGWVEDSICPPPSVRTVRWNDFWMLFTRADTDFWSGGVPHFFTYYYSGSTPSIRTSEGIGLGSTVSDLFAAYGGPSFVLEESPFVEGEGSWSYDLASWTGMWGFSTGQGPDDTVTAINGGRGCGE